jgi:hypothetical protein
MSATTPNLAPLAAEVKRLGAALAAGRARIAEGEAIVRQTLSPYVAAKNRLEDAMNKLTRRERLP